MFERLCAMRSGWFAYARTQWEALAAAISKTISQRAATPAGFDMPERLRALATRLQDVDEARELHEVKERKLIDAVDALSRQVSSAGQQHPIGVPWYGASSAPEDTRAADVQREIRSFKGSLLNV